MNQPDPANPLKRVLVIAEDSATRSHLVSLFERQGYTVLVAQDSMEALTLIDRRPQVIVLHAAVPASLGLDMLQSLRGRRPPLLVPAVLVASDGTLVVPAMPDGPQFLSDRPLPFDEVLAHVDRLSG